jgi:hypothetical protein
LDLNRFTVGFDNGFWATMRVTKVEPDELRPHGLQYSLTLHDENDDRILGYDNAHIVDVGSGPAKKSRRPPTADHVHRRGRQTVPYQFTSPLRLLQDFWRDVYRILDEDEGRS